MANLDITCSSPWIPTNTSHDRETVKVHVGKAPNTRQYALSTHTLKQVSGSFRTLLQDKPSVVHLPDQNPAIFHKFTAWLTQGILRYEDTHNALFLCQLYLFATTFSIPHLRNAIIDIFLQSMYRENRIRYDIIGYMEQHLRDSALRNMWIDVVLRCGDVEDVRDWNVSLAKGFFVKSVFVEGAIVPFGATGRVSACVGGIKGNVCEMYHEHEVDGGRDVEEGWFFDPPLEEEGV